MKKKEKKTYSLPDNICYVFKELFEQYPKAVWLLLASVLCGVAEPLVGTMIAPSAVYLIENRMPVWMFLAGMGGIAAIHLLVRVGQVYTNQTLGAVYIGARIRGFCGKILKFTTTTDYQNIETYEGQKKLEKAQEAIQYNTSGVEGMFRYTPDFVMNLAGLVLYGTAILGVDWRILFVLVLMLFCNILTNRYARGYIDKHKDEDAGIWKKQKYLYDQAKKISAGKDIRLFGMEGWLDRIMEQLVRDGTAWQKKAERRWYLPVASDGIFTAIRDLLAYGVLISDVMEGRISIAMFTFYLGIITGFSKWLFAVVGSYNDMKRASMETGYFREALDAENHFKREGGLTTGDMLQRPVRVEFQDVSFRYPGAKEDTIFHLNLSVREGEKIALVGHNGAGKTTIVKLLCGLYAPTEGKILVNGKSIEEYNLDEYFKLLGVVFQDVRTTSFTIRQNIAGADEADEKRLSLAAEQAGLKDKVESLEKGYDTYLSSVYEDENIQLSGGETQKLLLARAIYKDAPFLILDEPTSALDPIAEDAMYRQYHHMAKEKTAVFISHRLASTRFCDRILFLEHGKIIEEGSHDELMRKDGKYAYVYGVQSHYYTDENQERMEAAYEQ